MNNTGVCLGVSGTAQEKELNGYGSFCFAGLIKLPRGSSEGRYRFAYAELFNTECGFVKIEDTKDDSGRPVEIFCRRRERTKKVELFCCDGAGPVSSEAKKIAEEEFAALQENYLQKR